MAPRSSPPTQATLVAPNWMGEGRPDEFLNDAGLRTWPTSNGRWQVKTELSYLRQRPDLVWVEHLAGPTGPVHRLERLLAAQRRTVFGDSGGTRIDETTAPQERAQNSDQLVGGVVAWQAATLTARTEDLPVVVERVRDAFLVMRMANSKEPVMDSAGVHLVHRAPQLVHRAKLCLLLHQHEHDPRLQAGDVAGVQAVLAHGGLAFAASQGLYLGVFLGEVYLAPLLGALTLAVWAYCAPRDLGIVVYTIGQPLLGDMGNPVELLQTLPRQGADPDPDRERIPKLSPTAGPAALGWWTRRLSDMFGVLTNPVLATDHNDVYVASKQAHALLSTDQLFRRVASIQAASRDGHARRVVLLTVLDTLERHTGRPITKLCSARFARRRLEGLTAAIPSDAPEVLLPSAERAATALEELQDGFFLARQLGRNTVDVPDANGGTREVEFDRAAADYLKILRDATHGHGGQRDRVGLTNALLAQHYGKIPHDLGLLGYLYLQDLLLHPDNLAQRIFAGGQT